MDKVRVTKNYQFTGEDAELLETLRDRLSRELGIHSEIGAIRWMLRQSVNQDASKQEG